MQGGIVIIHRSSGGLAFPSANNSAQVSLCGATDNVSITIGFKNLTLDCSHDQ
jgi:hypothetical protein